MTTAYERGRDAEYRVMTELEALSYTALRFAGSHGGADVLAIGHGHYRFIQVKTWTKRLTTYRRDITKLLLLPVMPNTSLELWIRQIGADGWTKRLVLRLNTHTLGTPIMLAPRRPEADEIVDAANRLAIEMAAQQLLWARAFHEEP